MGFLDFNFSGSGLITGQRLCDILETRLKGVAIEALAKRFVAVATEIGTGHEIWLSRGRMVDAMRASYALPGIFRPVHDRRPLAVRRRAGQSGSRLGVPRARRALRHRRQRQLRTRAAAARSCRTWKPCRPPTPEPEAVEREEGLLARNGRAMKKLLQRQFFGRSDNGPGISRVMMEAFNIVQDRIARSRLAGDPPDVVICPRLPAFGLFDFHRAEAMIECGVAAAKREIEDIKREIALRTGAAPAPVLATHRRERGRRRQLWRRLPQLCVMYSRMAVASISTSAT